MNCECGCGLPAPLSRHTNAKRGWRRGEPRRFIFGHYRPERKSASYYKQIGRNGLLHRLRAEKALGHPLPVGAIVHHADGSRDDDAPLVICPDDGYHLALHARMRIQAAGGHPWNDKICARCQKAKPLDSFAKSSGQWAGRFAYCRECNKERRRELTTPSGVE
jgi:hypothetical protein